MTSMPVDTADGDRPAPVDVVVIGGGITGLVAAMDAVAAGLEVVLLEADDRVGGKLDARDLGTGVLDVGADSLVARHGAGVALAGELGMPLVHPTTGRVQLVADGRLRRLPAGAPYGAPTDLVDLARTRVLSSRGLVRAALEGVWPRRRWVARDRSVAEVVGERYGREVVERLVEPLLGGIYAGRPDVLSVEATTPLIAAADRRHRSLAHGLRLTLEGRVDRDTPVFATPVTTMSSLAATLAGQLGRVVRTGVAVRSIRLDAAGHLVVPATGDAIRAAHVIVATPAHVAAALLAEAAPGSAAELSGIEHASVTVVAMRYGRANPADLPDASGILVPRREGRLVKAATWLARKWPHLADRGTVLRASVGRIDDRRHLDLDDDELTDTVDREVRELTGLVATATQSTVVRWPDALPQYEVGHLGRIMRIRHHLPDGLHLAGAAYDGIGVSPCIASGRVAAAAVISRAR